MKKFLIMMLAFFTLMLMGGKAFGQQGDRKEVKTDKKVIVVDDNNKIDRDAKVDLDKDRDKAVIDVDRDKDKSGMKIEKTDRKGNKKEVVTKKTEKRGDGNKKVKKTKKVTVK